MNRPTDPPSATATQARHSERRPWPEVNAARISLDHSIIPDLEGTRPVCDSPPPGLPFSPRRAVRLRNCIAVEPVLTEWLSLLLRWLHVVAGIGWIGSSFYFIHLDLSLKPRDAPPAGGQGEAWPVDG